MIAEWIVRFHRGEKIARDEFGSLVDELVKGVLPVCSRFAPDDGTRREIHAPAVALNALAVALHVALLEVGGKPMQILIVRKNRVCLRAEEVVIPDAQQGEDDRQILLRFGGAEMLVDLLCTGEEFFKVLLANGEHDRKADG